MSFVESSGRGLLELPSRNESSVTAAAPEKYRCYIAFLARLHLDPRLQGKIDLSGIVQQTIFEAHQERAKWVDEPSQRRLAFLRQVLAHNLQDEIRRLTTGKRDVRREQSLERAFENSSRRLMIWLTAEDAGPVGRMEKSERAVRLAAALELLPEAQREALVLQHWEGCSLAEIGERMGRSTTAVAGLVKRGLRQLRAEL
jgi:RNA polymerase sigma-70 factor (ECF subfamily)